MLEAIVLPGLFRTFAEKTRRKQLFHDKYTIPAVVACHGTIAQSNFLQKCDMCQGIASHELWYPVEVMKFYCKHCHNFWVMKITWERSSPVQPQTVASTFLGLLHVMDKFFKFNF